MAAKLGIIAGSAFLDGVDLPGARLETIETAAGAVALHVGDTFAFIRRHGETAYRPPHRVPHHAHVLALESLGIRRAAGLTSTGALRRHLRPGDIVIPSDYMSLHPPPTFAGDEYLHIVPALDPDVRATLKLAAAAATRSAVGTTSVLDGGVYVQTHGPRFETAAEVRMLARDADVVGMTAASEATLCQERGIAYAMLCIIDNQAHGIGAEPLTLDGYREQLARNARLARSILRELIGQQRLRS
jgi:purine nucleoside phosphorylase